MSNIQTVFVQIIRKPERLCIIKRGRKAEDYFPYCEEVSCDVWGILTSMQSLCGEPVSMGLPQAVSTMREYKILKRLRVTPVSPVFILGVELTQGITMMKNAFIGADTGSMLLPVCVMLGLTALCTVLSIRFFRWE